jgi:hypothetical protein
VNILPLFDELIGFEGKFFGIGTELLGFSTKSGLTSCIEAISDDFAKSHQYGTSIKVIPSF